MTAYKIHLPGYAPFTMITTEPEGDIPACVYERFCVYPISVIKLV